MSVFLSLSLCVSVFNYHISLSICLSFCLSVSMCLCLFVCLSVFCMYVLFSVCLSLWLYIRYLSFFPIYLNLPSKEDLPQYYCKISEPIDFSSITASLSCGSYHSVAQVDQDILLLFQNITRFYGSSTRLGEYANQIRAKYLDLSTQSLSALQELVGPEGVLYHDVHAAHHDGHHHLPNWTRVLPAFPLP